MASSARRGLNRLPESVVAAVIELIDGPLKQEPTRVGKPLREPLAGLHSARRGQYRVLYKIDDENHRVVVVAIGHRSTIYRS